MQLKYIHVHIHVGATQQECQTGRHPNLCMKHKRWTESQTELLMKSFQANAYPGKKELDQLTKSCNSSKKMIQNWFSAKRLKETRKGMLPESE